jgi:hypothetical protein
MGDPAMNCFPCDVYRLFQTDPLVYKLIGECESYDELLGKFDAAVRHAIVDEHFVGVKCHVLEVHACRPTMSAPLRPSSVRKAKIGIPEAKETVYMASFAI